jgi:hypothetical protein
MAIRGSGAGNHMAASQNVAKKLEDPDVEAALSAVRSAVSGERAPRAVPRPAIDMTRRPSSSYSSPPYNRETAKPAPSRHEIAELTSRINSQLDRLAAQRPATSVNRDENTSRNGFAGILGGDTRVQDTPRPQRAVNGYDAGHHPDPYSSYAYEDVQSGEEIYDPHAHEDVHQVAPYASAYDDPHEPYEEAELPAMLSHDAANATQSAFNQLAETLMARAMGERSIEDVTRELLRTMLKNWLDENLPQMVERIVRQEIERVARRGSQR